MELVSYNQEIIFHICYKYESVSDFEGKNHRLYSENQTIDHNMLCC